jgi:sigma54-dependent transcription regulator
MMGMLVLQNVLEEELAELRRKVDANHRETMLRLEAINQRFDDLIDRLQLHRHVEDLETGKKGS